MVLVILAICVVLFAIGVAAYGSIYRNDTGEMLMFIGGFFGAIALAAAIMLGISVSFSGTIDDKIAMYEEENAKIENQIEAAVEKYMEYESETFAAASSESAITLVSLYPELKTDTLISSQIDIYVKNNKTIVELKEKKINSGVTRWWLYFGK